MKWIKMSGRVVRSFYRAEIRGGDALPLYAYIASNGDGWWNACISPSADDAMMEHPHRLFVAGATTLAGAKENAADGLTKYVAALNLATAYRPEVPDVR